MRVFLISWGGEIPRAKVLRGESGLHVLGAGRRLVWLEWSEGVDWMETQSAGEWRGAVT